MRLLDETGREEIRVNRNDGIVVAVSASALQPKGPRTYAQALMRASPGEFYVSRIDLNVENEQIEVPWQPVVRVGLRLGPTHSLIVNYRADDLLTHIEEAAQRSSVRTMLLDAHGYVLHGASEPGWGFLLGRPPELPDQRPEVWERLSRGGDGFANLGGTLVAWRRVALGAHEVTILGTTSWESRVAALRRALELSGIVGVTAWLGSVPLAFALGRARARREAEQAELRESADRLRELSSALIDAQERERERLARDLHDVLGQQLTVLSLTLQEALAGSEVRSDRGRAALGAVQETMQLVHELAVEIRPTLLDDLGLEAAVRSHVGQWTERSGVRATVEVEIREAPRRAVAAQAFRILQEALRNVQRHAEATSVAVTLHGGPEGLVLDVVDQGRGFHDGALAPGRLGLLGMRERALLVGGTLTVTSTPTEGTCVRLVVPAPEAE